MMPRICYHDTQQKVQAACDRIFINMLKQRANEGDGTLYDNPGVSNNKVAISSMSDQALLNIPLLGKKSGSLNRGSGYTLRWDKPEQCDNDNAKYYAEIHPDAAVLEGAVCETAEFSKNWLSTELGNR